MPNTLSLVTLYQVKPTLTMSDSTSTNFKEPSPVRTEAQSIYNFNHEVHFSIKAAFD